MSRAIVVRPVCTAILLSCTSSLSIAYADEQPPVLSVGLHETLDGWRTTGGIDPGPAVLSKLQLLATVNADRLGLSGLRFHTQVFRTDGDSLSTRIGDIQTADNIEAEPVTRLFEAWVEASFGRGERKGSVRAGLLDYNADFDSITTGSMFVNSSHGIGPDISKSGRNGPSIFPVSALGLRGLWSPSAAWTFRAAAFDGVPGDPDHPHAFARVKLRDDEGALLAAQVDRHLTAKTRVTAGLWRYTVPLPDSVDPAQRHADQGGYASIEGPPDEKLTGWLRLGIAEHRVQPVSAYLGGGLVREAPFAGRDDDRVGIAIGHAALSGGGAETTVEASYQFKVSE